MFPTGSVCHRKSWLTALCVLLLKAEARESNGRELKPVVAVAVRNPYDVAYVETETTWLATYSSTPVALESLSRVLFGEVRPRGKLPVNIPFAEDPTMTRYPFGYGLSW